jgi:hypothetical protein
MDDKELELLNRIDIPVFVLELDAGRLIYASINDAVCRITGMERSAFLGKSAHDIFPGRCGRIAYRLSASYYRVEHARADHL